MIAPARGLLEEKSASTEARRRQRRIALPLLPPPVAGPSAPPVEAWKAWILAIWIASVTAAYVYRLWTVSVAS